MAVIKKYYKLYRTFPEPNYFYLENTSSSSGTMTLTKSGTPASTDLQYSLDRTNWTTVDLTQSTTTATVPANSKIYFRSSTGFNNGAHNGGNSFKFLLNQNHNAGGDMRTLLNYLNIEGVTEIPQGAFNQMFKGDYMLYNISDLKLTGITTVKSYAFHEWSTFGNYAKGLDISQITTLDGIGQFDAMYNSNPALNLLYAPNISSWNTNQFNGWVYDMSSSGVVMKPSTLTIPTNSHSGVPSGWTTQDY